MTSSEESLSDFQRQILAFLRMRSSCNPDGITARIIAECVFRRQWCANKRGRAGLCSQISRACQSMRRMRLVYWLEPKQDHDRQQYYAANGREGLAVFVDSGRGNVATDE